MGISIEQFRSRISTYDNFLKTKDASFRFKDRVWNIMLMMFYLSVFYLPTLKQVVTAIVLLLYFYSPAVATDTVRFCYCTLFLVFTHVMRRPCWCTKQWQNVVQVLHNNRIKFPKEFLRYCSVHQHGRRDVM